MSGPIFAVAQVASTNGPAGSGRSASFSTAPNTAAGAAPSSGQARPLPGYLQRPAGRLGLHRLQRRELPAAPKAVADIRHRALDLRFIPHCQLHPIRMIGTGACG